MQYQRCKYIKSNKITENALIKYWFLGPYMKPRGRAYHAEIKNFLHVETASLGCSRALSFVDGPPFSSYQRTMHDASHWLQDNLYVKLVCKLGLLRSLYFLSHRSVFLSVLELHLY